jgi:urease accessory protein
MGWSGRLEVRYGAEGGRTVGRDRHVGPLRVLQSLYPEGPGVCHQVLVHPPGGLVGGDRLEIELDLEAGSHALITTPGATRFYRSTGATAIQTLRARLQPGARLEWLPLETLIYNGAQACNRQVFDLQGDARLIAWDVLALGLPASDQPFVQGRHEQHVELPGIWLERAVIDAHDRRLLDSPVGWAGHRVLATAFASSGEAQPTALIESLLDAARQASHGHALAATCGATALHGERGVVMRMLAPRVEPAMQLLSAVWAAWRPIWIGRGAQTPRVWRM